MRTILLTIIVMFAAPHVNADDLAIKRIKFMEKYIALLEHGLGMMSDCVRQEPEEWEKLDCKKRGEQWLRDFHLAQAERAKLW